MKSKQITVDIICILFIVLWVYACLSKWTNPEFTNQLNKSPYLEGLFGFVSVVLPLGELIIAALLLFPATQLLGLYLSLFTIVLFTGYIYAMVNLSYYKPYSILSELDWNTHIILNLAFCLFAVTGILLWKKPESKIKFQRGILKNAEV